MNEPRQVTAADQMLIRKPESLWPVTVILATCFPEGA